MNRVWGFIIRNRAKLQDAFLVAAAVAVTTDVIYETDFPFLTTTSHPKSIQPEELPVIGIVLTVGLLIFAWRRSQEQKRETRKRIAAEQHARELAMLDPLTGLPNRRQFLEQLTAALASRPHAGGAHALLLLDLNGFKQVNDVYGHGAGDEVLITVGERLMGAVRHGDLVARLGGDEFAVLAEHLAGPEAATSVALRIIEALETPIQTGDTCHTLGAGIGVAMLPITEGTPEEAMRRADVALYKAKADPRSCLRFFDEDMDRQGRERELLERELRAAIGTEDIQPFFQPLVDLKTKKVVGFEALARWTHKELGNIPPDRFIPIAEDSGLIHALSDQLLRQACRAARTWPEAVTLSFNISPVQLTDRTLGLRVLSILDETGLPPTRLEVEITESALVRDIDAAREVLGSLHDAGIRIALDDFVTGYSSLYYLRNFKIDTIKFDRTFVDRMGVERESAEIVSALVGLGRGLGMTVIAEGIEGSAQDAELLAQGCHQGQGFLFGQAVSAKATEAFFPEWAEGTTSAA